ncbi:MAG TPA: succinate dehydrogenase cytochrome b subunit [Verrucomicrobiae bacterium]|nr:succinate dehydrogenase cytochrome b subunit [Verrucomicrobiae bacterium]
MKVVTNMVGSSLGKKFIMAVTGLVLFLFVVAHLIGNLQVFLGAEAINRYGHFLQSNPELIWPARVFLILMVVLHIWSATKLSLENKAARPVPYGEYQPVGSSYASRTMLMSGIIIFIFISYHLLHFTAQVQYINLTGRSFVDFVDPEKRHDIFKMLVVGFSNIWVSGFYVLGMALLCLHLSHGVSSMFQSLGWKNKAYGPCLDRAARAIAWVLFLGYISIPIAILLGYGREALR